MAATGRTSFRSETTPAVRWHAINHKIADLTRDKRTRGVIESLAM